MTYPLFATPKIILDHVVGIARTAAGEAQNTPVLLRAINLLKSWVEHYWDDFSNDAELLATLNTCVDEFESQKLFQMLKNVIKRKMGPKVIQASELNYANFPKSILPKSKNSSSSDLLSQFVNAKEVRGSIMGLSGKFSDTMLKLTDLDPIEVARQITLMEHELFMSIKVYFL